MGPVGDLFRSIFYCALCAGFGIGVGCIMSPEVRAGVKQAVKDLKRYGRCVCWGGVFVLDDIKPPPEFAFITKAHACHHVGVINEPTVESLSFTALLCKVFLSVRKCFARRYRPGAQGKEEEEAE